jgi:hypothetical protein
MTPSRIARPDVLAMIVAVGLTLSSQAAAAPTAEVAKRCLHYAYIVYPYKRPGAAPMSGDRQAYFQDCMAKNGEVPEPAKSDDKSRARTPAAAPASRINSEAVSTPPAETDR